MIEGCECPSCRAARDEDPYSGKPATSEGKLRKAYAEAVELADGEAVEACGLLLAAVGEFLGESQGR